MRDLYIDLETYSAVDIKTCGMYKYVDSNTFEVLLFAYSIDGAPAQVVDIKSGERIPQEIYTALFDTSVTKHAHNAAFEWYCLSKYLYAYAPLLWLRQWQCTMIHCLYCSFPASLDAAGAALGLEADKRKLSTGKALIKIFCKPQEPKQSNGNRSRILPQHEPEKWELFKTYNRQDVDSEVEIERRLSGFPVPPGIWAQWHTDVKINSGGVKLDMDMVEGALAMSDAVTAETKEQLRVITGLDNPASNKQFLKWLQQMGADVDNTRKETLEGLADESGIIGKAVTLRLETSKSSIKKYDAMRNTVCSDGRVRGTLQFYGASRTGRWGGRFIQPQNMPRTYIHGDMLEYVRDLIRQRRAADIKLLFGSLSDTMSQLIRTAIIAEDGSIFVDADFSAIEARVVAWLAGEEWVLDVFRTHGKIYEAAASQMFGVPIEHIKKGRPEYSLRQKGKVATLALGYGGSKNALINMGALRMGLTEDELPEIVSRWRSANRRICDLWQKLERGVIQTFHTGTPCAVNGLLIAREGDSVNGLDFITITLPSGRKMFYAFPHMGKNRWNNDSIHYLGTNKKWTDIETYGGKLTENIVQAIARDCLAVKMEELTALGYRIVFHVHDEVVLEMPEDTADLQTVCAIMSRPIPWAKGLPLNADGYVSKFFKKD